MSNAQLNEQNGVYDSDFVEGAGCGGVEVREDRSDEEYDSMIDAQLVEDLEHKHVLDRRVNEILGVIDRRIGTLEYVAATTGQDQTEQTIHFGAECQIKELRSLRDELVSKYQVKG